MAATQMSVTSEPASDAWGFVGVITVGGTEAYRTLAAFPTPSEAENAAQRLLVSVIGEMLAGAEWRQVRDATGTAPTRADYNFSPIRRPGDRDGLPRA